MRRFLGRAVLAAAALRARGAAACAVCFGRGVGTAGLFRGIWWGVVVLLTVVLSLVGGIAWAMWSIERRRSRSRDA